MENTKQSLEEIEKYIINIKFKTSLFGGLKRIDVYQQIKNIHSLYSDYVEKIDNENQMNLSQIAVLTDKLQKTREKNIELMKQRKEKKSKKEYDDWSPVSDVQYRTASIIDEAKKEADRIIQEAQKKAEQEVSIIRKGLFYEIQKSQIAEVNYSKQNKEIISVLEMAESEIRGVQKHIEQVKSKIEY